MCRSIRFKDGKQIDAMLCRVPGYIPTAAPSRKAKVQLEDEVQHGPGEPDRISRSALLPVGNSMIC
jgi:hypothetical protein